MERVRDTGDRVLMSLAHRHCSATGEDLWVHSLKVPKSFCLNLTRRPSCFLYFRDGNEGGVERMC